jgi:hypothetical protein
MLEPDVRGGRDCVTGRGMRDDQGQPEAIDP